MQLTLKVPKSTLILVGVLFIAIVTSVSADYVITSFDVETTKNTYNVTGGSGNTSAQIEAVIGANASYTRTYNATYDAGSVGDGYEKDTNMSTAGWLVDGWNRTDQGNSSAQIEAVIGANLTYTQTYNSTYDNALMTTIYYPNVTLTTSGTNITDNITQMWYVDHLAYNITEDNGALPLTVYINYTGITSFSQWIVNEYYEGSASHHIEFQLYIFDSDLWETHDDIVGQSGFTTEVKHIYDDDMHIKDGVVMTRFIHIQSGSTSHKFDIDYAWLTEGSDIASSTNLAGYAEYNFASNPFTGTGNFTTTGTGSFKNLVITAADEGWNRTDQGNSSAEIEAVIGANMSYVRTYNSTYDTNVNTANSSEEIEAVIGANMSYTRTYNVTYDTNVNTANSSEQIEAVIGANASYTRTYNATYDGMSAGSMSNVTGDFNISGNLYLGNTDGNRYIYFHDTDATGQYIWWDDGSTKFQVSTSMYVTNTLQADAVRSEGVIYTTGAADDLWLGTGTQASSTARFYANGTLKAEYGHFSSNVVANAYYGDGSQLTGIASGTDTNMSTAGWLVDGWNRTDQGNTSAEIQDVIAGNSTYVRQINNWINGTGKTFFNGSYYGGSASFIGNDTFSWDDLSGERGVRIGSNELSGVIVMEYKLAGDNTAWHIDNGGDNIRFFNSSSLVFGRVNRTGFQTDYDMCISGAGGQCLSQSVDSRGDGMTGNLTMTNSANITQVTEILFRANETRIYWNGTNLVIEG